MMLAVIRIRGTIDIKPSIKKTLELLMLHKANHLVLLPQTNPMTGMVEKAKDYVTFGEIGEKTCAKLLEKRGRLSGGKRLSKKFLEEHKLKDFFELAKTIIAGEKKLADFGIKPVFRLSPPKKGFERAGIKKSFKIGGALGNRNTDINQLIEKMA
ncbi:MAG: 50S ribosomal protein L30 [Candidatus Diapherotrites archaeon]|nr:50S ribosomal protein L30 [Candidatus Diapherotrites archaeon]